MRILVTGGAGFIGSAFARHVLHTYADYTVIVYDKLTYAGLLSRLEDLKEGFPHRFSFLQGDICDEAAVRRTLLSSNVDAIVNFAGESHVDRSLDGPDLFVHTNVLGTSVLVENAVACGIDKFVHVSTDEGYGDISFGSVIEEAPLFPRNAYAASKAGAEDLHTNQSVANTILLLLERDPNMAKYVKDRPSNDRRYLMSTQKIRSLGWAPAMEIEEGLSQTIRWYDEMSSWCQPLLEIPGAAMLGGA